MSLLKCTAISDLHGYRPDNLPGGDLLIIAGDICARDEDAEWELFFDWLHRQNYRKKILVGGNHDNWLIDAEPMTDELDIFIGEASGNDFVYLCNSACEFEGLKIWGSPNSLWFDGIHPKCKAFTCHEKDMRKLVCTIPRDIDILITHGPPEGIFDSVQDMYTGEVRYCGSVSLRCVVLDGANYPNLQVHIFGHIHEHGGRILDTASCRFINASNCDEHYGHREPGYVEFELNSKQNGKNKKKES